MYVRSDVGKYLDKVITRIGYAVVSTHHVLRTWLDLDPNWIRNIEDLIA